MRKILKGQFRFDKVMLTRVIWFLWFVFLTSTPFHLAEPYRGPILTGFYAWVATGIFLGAVLLLMTHYSDVLKGHFRPIYGLSGYLLIKVTIAVGFVVGLGLCVFELISLPLALCEGPEAVYGISLPSETSFLAEHFGVIHVRVWVECIGAPLLLFSSFAWSVAPTAFPLLASGDCNNENISRRQMLCFAALVCVSSILNIAIQYGAFHLENDGTFFEYGDYWGLNTDWVMGCMPFVGNSLTLALALASVKKYRQSATAIYMLFLTSSSLGVLGWNFASRCAFSYDGVAPFVWQVLKVIGCFVVCILFILIVLIATNQAKEKGKRSQLKSGGSPSQFDIKVLEQETAGRLESLELAEGATSLTKRELQCVACLWEGLSSMRSAELLGLKASTVRAYLQRAYKKLNVRDQDDLLNRMGRRNSTIEDLRSGKERQQTVAEEGNGLANLLVRCSLPLLFALLLGTPFFVDSSKSATTIFGISIGMMSAGLMSLICGRPLSVLKFRMNSLLAVIIFGAIVASIIFITKTADLLMSFVCSALVAGFVLLFSLLTFDHCQKRPKNGLGLTWAYVLTYLCAGFLVQLASLPGDTPLSSSLSLVSIVSIGFETAIACTIWKRGGRLRALVILSLVLILQYIGAFPGIVVLVGSIALCLPQLVPYTNFAKCFEFALFGMGLGFGRIASHAIADTMAYNNWLFNYADPGDTQFLMYSFAVAVVLAIVAVAAYGQFYREVRSDSILSDCSLSDAAEIESRVRAFLLSKGLSSMQIEVGVCLLHARTTSEVCESLFVSPGTVNKSRYVLYRLLDVNSRESYVRKLLTAIDVIPRKEA